MNKICLNQITLSRDRKQRQNRHITCDIKDVKGGRMEGGKPGANSSNYLPEVLIEHHDKINKSCKAVVPLAAQLESGPSGHLVPK